MLFSLSFPFTIIFPSSDMAISPSNTASKPLVSSEMAEHETESPDSLVDNIRKAVEVFLSMLSKIATDHRR